MSHVYCPECGFQNPEAANYCAKCGALLHTPESAEQTQTFNAAEAGDELDHLDDIRVEGPALVVRSGGGRAGETFTPQSERTTIGRSPDCPVFLGEQPVATLGPARRDEAFGLEVADLRDRDVGELRLQPAANCADGQEARS